MKGLRNPAFLIIMSALGTMMIYGYAKGAAGLFLIFGIGLIMVAVIYLIIDIAEYIKDAPNRKKRKEYREKYFTTPENIEFTKNNN